MLIPPFQFGPTRIQASVRVAARQVASTFAYAKQPHFKTTDFLTHYGPANAGSDDQKGLPTAETDLVADVVHARVIEVPHDNVVDDLAYVPSPPVTPYHHPRVAWTIEDSSLMDKIGTTPETETGCFAYATGWEWQANAYTSPDGDNEPIDPDTNLPYPEFTPEGVYLYATSEILDCQGFVAKWFANWFEPSFPQDGSPMFQPSPEEQRPWGSLRMTIGNPGREEHRYFAVVGRMNGRVEVWEADDVDFTSNPRKLQDLVNTSRVANFASPIAATFGGNVQDLGTNGEVMIDVRLIAGMLEIRLGSQDTPWSWPIQTRDGDDNLLCYIRQLRFVAGRFAQARWRVRPMKFVPDWYFTSKVSNNGFVPLNEPAFTIHKGDPQPDGTSFTGEYQTAGTLLQYQLQGHAPVQATYGGQDYSKYTASARSVSYEYDEVAYSQSGTTDYLYPEEVTVNQQFFPEDLCATTGAVLTFNNFSELSKLYPTAPSIFFGEWANHAGAIAVSIEFNVDYYDVGAEFPRASTGWYTAFTGFGNLKSVARVMAGGQSKYVMYCHGREIQLQTPKFGLPWFDGWNTYAYAAYLAEIGGVASSSFNFEKFGKHVPEDPYDDSPSGFNAYFLPQGTGGSPLMSFPGGESPWGAMGKVGRQIGYVRLFDEHGEFIYEPFTPTADRPYRTFYITDGYQLGEVGNTASAIFMGEVTRDLLAVRNHSTLIGVNQWGPLWDPLVSHRWDPGSIYGPGGSIWDGSQSNFIGFENAFVWMDSQFADEDYIADANDAIMAVIKLPKIDSNYQTWLQPDLYPGYWLAFHDRRTGSYDLISDTYLSYFLVGHSQRVANGQVPTSTLQLRYLPPNAGSGSNTGGRSIPSAFGG